MLPSKWVTVKRLQAMGAEVGRGLAVGKALLTIDGDGRGGLAVADGRLGVVCIESN